MVLKMLDAGLPEKYTTELFEAARLGRAASQSGLNCPLADVLSAACARRHKAKLIHDDKHLKALLEL